MLNFDKDNIGTINIEEYFGNMSENQKKLEMEKIIYLQKLEDLKKSEESDLMKRIKKIFYIYLKNDQEYFELLNKSIEPNLFLLRWILCVLNREISLKNIFWIWT